MKHNDKALYLFKHHTSEWFSTIKVVEDEQSDLQLIWCCCGRLATGIHERNCSRFRRKVQSLTISRLAHLLPKGE